MPPLGPICVIFNPAAGRGAARKLIRSIRKEMDVELDLRPTHHCGHAVELARAAAYDGYPVVVAAGGDGTVHEVANGILGADRPETVFSVWPIGSANDYAFALGIKPWWRRKHPPPVDVRTVDVGLVEGGGKSEFFVNGLGVGFNGGVTLESRNISGLRGMPLYGLATLKALWRHFGQPVMRARFDDLNREAPTLALTVNLGIREGSFPLTPNAKLDDGWFDCIQAGPLTRWQVLKLLPRMAAGTLPTDDPNLWMGRCRRAVIESPTPLRVHVDGEFFCHPDQGIRELKIELLPGRLKALCGPEGGRT